MRPHLRYLRYLLRHKWFVLVAGLRVGAPLWRLLIHDWSKFTPGEWGGYVRTFYGVPREEWIRRQRDEWLPHCGFNGETARGMAEADWRVEKRERAAAFDHAWLRHQRRNPHHWQHWVLMEDQPSEGHYPRYAITSMDGGLLHHALTEYTERFDPRTSEPVQVDLLGLEDDGRPVSQARYRMVSRCVRAANRYRALPMPYPLAREMVADWMGAGRAITGRWEVAEWYAKNRELIVLHPSTRRYVEDLLGVKCGYRAAAQPVVGPK